MRVTSANNMNALKNSASVTCSKEKWIKCKINK